MGNGFYGKEEKWGNGFRKEEECGDWRESESGEVGASKGSE